MNPDVVQTALAGPAGGFSLLALFWQAHIVVKLVVLGLLAASVWCWAIIVDKLILYARTRRSMDHFETVFWSGQSLEQLYQQVAGARGARRRRALRRGDARVEAHLRIRRALAARTWRPHRPRDGRDAGA